jgi:hypothetical protein
MDSDFCRDSPPRFIKHGDTNVCAECGGRDENGGIHADYCSSNVATKTHSPCSRDGRLVRVPK